MKRGLYLFVFFIFILSVLVFLPVVSAENVCCQKDTSGNWCQYTDVSDCDASYLSTSTSCEQTSFCQVGCCYSSEEGSCSKNTPRSTCQAEDDYAWSDSGDCAIDQCNYGCCTIGDQAFFVTEVKCKSVGSAYEEAAVSFDDNIATEYACLNSVKNLNLGCCVDGDEAIFETRQECDIATTDVGVNFTVEGFHEGMLCSNDLLSTECVKEQYTGCYNGLVYWYDSCGNRENIYTSDERESYNSGYVLEEEDSCTTTGPYDENCGNCDYTQGQICGVDEDNVMTDGDYTCIDLDCESTYENDASPQSGEAKKNGESWCLYDTDVGEGLDTAGSRHYRSLCINGEELVEPCTDYREEICVGGVLGEDSLSNLEALRLGDGDYVEAACRENRGDTCSACNDETLGLTDRYECCGDEDLRDCYWLPTGAGVQEGDTYEEGRCTPQVPQGQKFWGEDSDSNDISSSTCAVASTTCTVTYRIGGVKKLILRKADDASAWTKIGETPDGCASKNWLVDQNTYCRSLGDCGAYYNLVGEPSYDGFSSTMFDESFFEDAKDIEEFDEGDLGDWDSLKFVDDVDESKMFFSLDTPHVFENPVFYVATVSALIGGFSNLADKSPDSCMASVAAKAAAKVAKDATSAIVGTVASGEKCVSDSEKKEEICAKGLDCLDNGAGKKICQEKKEDETSAYGDCSVSGTSCIDDYSCETTPRGKFCLPKSYGADEGAAELVTWALDIDTCGKTDATKGMSCACTLEQINNLNDDNDDSFYEGYCFSSSNINKYCCTSSVFSGAPALAPSVPQLSANVEDIATNTATGVATEKVKGLGKATDKLGCFVGGALPIPTSWIGGATKSGLTKWANRITLIATVYLIIDYAADNETTIVYTADCNTWQPPKGGDDCELCNNENMPCSEYRCHAYGASCTLLNEGSGNETCASQHINDVNSPILEPLTEGLEMEGYTIRETTDEGDKGYVIQELVPPFTPLTLGVTTDEPAQCKYTAEIATEFDDMSTYLGTSIYTYNHSLTFSLGSEVTSEEIVALNGGEYTVYVRCADSNGNANERDYFIRFTVDTTPDLTPSEILYTSITNGAYMQYGANETAFSIYTNEPAQCKWNINDTDYERMSTSMSCSSSGFQQSSAYFGSYECSTTLTGIATSELNYFYFKCEDTAGNQNEESFKFTTKQTKSPLIITSVSPVDGDTVYDITFNIEVETEEGAERGKAICGFSPNDVGYYSMAQFFTTNSTSHSQSLTLPEGEYMYYITCQDLAGNQASNSTSFTVEVDTSGPSIESLFVDTKYSILSLTTDEDSTCEYAPESFSYGEGSIMIGVNITNEHEANLDAYQYYVLCRDLYNNEESYFIDLSAWV